ncbi:14112_t:CDS:2, partial [Cetraspora pellucida]
FDEVWNDNIEKQTTEIIFNQCILKGVNWRSEESFCTMNWNIKYKNSKHTVKEILEKSKIINKEIKREEIVIIDSQIKSSLSNKRKFVELSDKEELSDIQLDVSEYTYRRKKEKQRIDCLD